MPGYDRSWAWHEAVAKAVTSFVTVGDNALGRSIARRLAIWEARRYARGTVAFDELASVEDGNVVSVVGRARAERTLPFLVVGKRVIGVVLRFPLQTMHTPEDAGQPTRRRMGPATDRERAQMMWRSERVELEAAHDFEVAGPSGQRVAVAVEDARIMANPGFPFRDLDGGEKIVDAIGLPVGANGADVRGGFLWDEAMVEVIGVKKTRTTATGGGPEITIGSAPDYPALVVPRGL